MASPEFILDQLKSLEAYYNKSLNEPQVKVYLRLLAPYPENQLQAAIDKHYMTGNPYFPKVSEILLNIENSYGLLEEKNNNVYWNAMGLFNASLRGDVSERQLYDDSTWKWYQRQANYEQA